MSDISRILELAGLSRIDESLKTEVSDAGDFGFLRNVNKTKVKEASWHQRQRAKRNGPVNWQHATQWTVVSDPPGEMSSAMSFPTEGKAKEYLERLKERGKDRGCYIVPPKNANDVTESMEFDENEDEEWDWEQLARHEGWYDKCIKIGKLFNMDPKKVWEIKNHMHNWPDGHIPHGVMGKAVAEYIDQENKDDTKRDHRLKQMKAMDDAFYAGLRDSFPNRR
jgi:hypothetical protein